MVTISAGESSLKDFVENLGASNLNEAETRLKIIDKIIRDCLGWDDSLFSLEHHINGEYADYVIGKKREIVIEAKKEGVFFEIPADLTKKIISDISSICKLSTAARDAIHQVQNYCVTRGAAIAIVTNGHQYIIFFPTRTDGIAPLDGKCVAIRSLQHFIDNFAKLWQYLSPSGVKEGHLRTDLLSGIISLPDKLSSRLSEYPKHRYVSELQHTLKSLSDLLIQDIFETKEIEKEFYKECYSSSGALPKHTLLARDILTARYSSMFSSNELKPIIQSVTNKKSNGFSTEVIAEAASARPIVLLGDVGVGKTSFIKNLMLNSANEEFKNSIYLYIDLGYNATLSADLKNSILDQIKVQLLENYNTDINEESFVFGVYSSDIIRFSKSIWGRLKDTDLTQYENKKLEHIDSLMQKSDNHLKLSIQHLSKERQQQIIIIIDNADQREFNVQQDAFVIAQELAKNWSSIVFISVRPKTFFASKKYGALSAYPNKLFVINPPKIDDVILKRLSFALNMAQGKIPIDLITKFNLSSQSLVLFLETLIFSLNNNKMLVEFISNITGGNVREAIELIKSFIGSPNVDSEKISRQWELKSSYIIPIHEFSKPALLGDLSHFSSESSIALNLYDIDTPDPKEHFLKSLVIAFLSADNNSQKDSDGFINLENLQNEMQNLGFGIQQIHLALRKLVNKKLIEVNKRVTFEENVVNDNVNLKIFDDDIPELLRVTTSGIYHVDKWAPTFAYLDAMTVDTQIFDSEIFNELTVNVNSHNILDRYHRALKFKEYLINMWEISKISVVYFDFLQKLALGNDSFDKVKFVCDEMQK